MKETIRDGISFKKITRIEIKRQNVVFIEGCHSSKIFIPFFFRGGGREPKKQNVFSGFKKLFEAQIFSNEDDTLIFCL
jgi:hypothetical protein